ncbi:MAG: helix-turn-helix transcriptional regulator [Clostridia bacterium]|nr:helix-turn-helix transcriptional regulator [Clostridia bacterium]
MNPEILGNRIKVLLEIRQIKRAYLAKKMNTSYNTLTKKLQGKREFDYMDMVKIVEVLELEPQLIFNLFFNPNFDFNT